MGKKFDGKFPIFGGKFPIFYPSSSFPPGFLPHVQLEA
jgi:hypothetical protein